MLFANMGFCLFKGHFGKIGKTGQPHPYTTARLIFLVRLANLGQVVRWGSHMEPRRVDKNELKVTTVLTKFTRVRPPLRLPPLLSVIIQIPW